MYVVQRGGPGSCAGLIAATCLPAFKTRARVEHIGRVNPGAFLRSA
jgi:hypothetical protein